MKLMTLLMLLVIAGSNCAWAGLKTKDIEYGQGDVILQGYLVYDDSITGVRPGILVVHEWTGLGPYAKMRADMLARSGYIAFAADIYGKGIRPTNAKEAGEEATKYKNNRQLLRSRVLAGLEVLKKQPNVDSSRLAAIGYCFGGTAVLELVRSGEPVKGAVSFHGGLSTPTPGDAKNIKAQILVLHGADDPFVLPQEVTAFEKEMNNAHVAYTIIKYPGAQHSFTNPESKGQVPGALYNAKADAQSWQAMLDFFKRIFQEK